MAKSSKIQDSNEAWENGQLGRDEAHIATAEPDESLINSSLGLQPISIRLEKSLIDDFKLIAEIHGLAYQPLMRQALRRFAESEKRRLLRESVCQAKQDENETQERRVA
ncbi:hypothetical protein AFAE65S_02827 [Alcaligenes phenolicus]